MEITSRKEAIAKGLQRYFTGKPCCRGHKAERYSSTGICVPCIALLSCEWAHKNPEKIKEKDAKRARKYPEKARVAKALWRQKYPDRNRAYHRERGRKIMDLLVVLRETNPELLKEFGL